MPPPKAIPRLRGRLHRSKSALPTLSEISTVLPDESSVSNASQRDAKIKDKRRSKGLEDAENMPSTSSIVSAVGKVTRPLRPKRNVGPNYKEPPTPANPSKTRKQGRGHPKKIATELSVLTEASETFEKSPQQAVYDELFGERNAGLGDQTPLSSTDRAADSVSGVSQTRSMRSRNGLKKVGSSDKAQPPKSSTKRKNATKSAETVKTSKPKAASKAKALKRAKVETSDLLEQTEFDAFVTVVPKPKDATNESIEPHKSEGKSLRSQSRQKSQTKPEQPSQAKSSRAKPKANKKTTVSTTKKSRSKSKPKSSSIDQGTLPARTAIDEASESNEMQLDHSSDNQFTSPPPGLKGSVAKSRVNQLINANSMAPIKIYSPSNVRNFKMAANNTIIITDRAIRKACGNRTHLNIDKDTRFKIDADSKLFYLPKGDTPKQLKKKPIDPLALLQRKRQSIFAMSIQPDEEL